MSTFKTFEEIHAWQKARVVTHKIYCVSNEGQLGRDFGLRDQMRRAAVSVMANIAEGHGRRTETEFANFLNLSRGSAVELQSHLYVALDLGYITDGEFREVYDLLTEISKMTLSLSQYLRKQMK